MIYQVTIACNATANRYLSLTTSQQVLAMVNEMFISAHGPVNITITATLPFGGS